MIKKRADQSGIQIADSQLNGLDLSTFGCKTQEQFQRVAVRGQRMTARLSLTHKAVGEKRLQS